MCEISPIVNGQQNLCRVSKFLNRTKNDKGKQSVAVLTYMKKMKGNIETCIKAIRALSGSQTLRDVIPGDVIPGDVIPGDVIANFASKLEELLDEAYDLGLKQTGQLLVA